MLVCSPMGCVRDRIPPEHFIKKLKEFQKTTGAKVIVASRGEKYDERPLRNGQTHSAFLAKLRQLISTQTAGTPPTTIDTDNSKRKIQTTEHNFLDICKQVKTRLKTNTDKS